MRSAGSGPEGLPESRFELRAGSFVLTLWRDWLTNEVVDYPGRSERQRRAVGFLEMARTISNSVSQERFEVSERTAPRDLDELAAKSILERVGTTGEAAHDVLGKGVTKGSKGS